MELLRINMLRILNKHYKSKTEKVAKELFETIKEDFDDEIKVYLKGKTKIQIIALAKQLKEEDKRNELLINPNNNRLIIP